MNQQDLSVLLDLMNLVDLMYQKVLKDPEFLGDLLDLLILLVLLVQKNQLVH